ncbi:MAG: UDP-glucose/GDP-mannose dehydrogenase family protein [Pseudomonadota bacterium]
MKIAVIGTGYVGLVTGACFAETGNDVTCVDADESKVSKLKKGEVPFYEPGLNEIVKRNVTEGRLKFLSDTARAAKEAEVSFICVGTPSAKDGSVDLSQVFEASRAVAAASEGKTILTIKSTVPPGTADRVASEIGEKLKLKLRVVSNPEFLREGSAVQDCLIPDRVVVGTEDEDLAALLKGLYHPFVRTGNPIFILDRKSAEMTKYASNALLAARISFINEISMLCERVGADVTRVRAAVGADHRIGMQYLFPSLGFGGSCFPKDVRGLAALAREKGMNPGMLQATLDANEAQKKNFVDKVLGHFAKKGGAAGKRVAIWGLAFKAKTDDIRESAALTVVDHLLKAKMRLTVFDPEAITNVKSVYEDRLEYAHSAYAALEGADALCVLTEWNQFRHPDFGQLKKLLRSPVIFDGRNLYHPETLAGMGFTYYSVGRPPEIQV